MQAPGHREVERIPALDGWRGIAILMVLAFHFGPFNIGKQGVGIFFVLSGYLITGNLLREQEQSGRIDLRSFYLRRFFRLMPCAWALLAVAALLGLADGPDLASCVFFYRNYLVHPHKFTTNPFWSLSIEEQFYLVWPATLLLLGRTRARTVAIVAASGFALWRFLTPHSFLEEYWRWTQFHADALLLGCFFALTPIPKLPRWGFWSLVGVLIACIYAFPLIPPFGESIVIAWLIHTTAQGGIPAAQSVLNFKPLAQIGVLSYSIYIWNFPFYGIPHSTPLGLLLALGCVGLMAVVSFYCIETPARRFGARLLSRLRRAAPVDELVRLPS